MEGGRTLDSEGWGGTGPHKTRLFASSLPLAVLFPNMQHTPLLLEAAWHGWGFGADKEQFCFLVTFWNVSSFSYKTGQCYQPHR